jgi:hypothetical protein
VIEGPPSNESRGRLSPEDVFVHRLIFLKRLGPGCHVFDDAQARALATPFVHDALNSFSS